MKGFATLRIFATTLPVAVGRLQGFPKGVYLSVTGPLLKGDLRREYTIHSLGNTRYKPPTFSPQQCKCIGEFKKIRNLCIVFA